ncbi:uncharacterized protein LOC143895387 [Temnothorax americanus]|uniref:uncharacterized protein LOC143895387 n=1 Tax=Temnothorax americanus TaxID=1964332 RepID=UPI004068040D
MGDVWMRLHEQVPHVKSNDRFCPYLLSSETTAKGTGLEKLAGKEDPVELDSSLADQCKISCITLATLYNGLPIADTMIRNGNPVLCILESYLVPTGTFLHLNIYGVHRDPNFWSNPEVFDPDRFLPEKI